MPPSPPSFSMVPFRHTQRLARAIDYRCRHLYSRTGDLRNFDELCTALVKLNGEVGHESSLVFLQRQVTAPKSTAPAIEVDEENEEENVPHGHKYDDLMKHFSRLMKRSSGVMVIVTALVLVFADPMLDVMSPFGPGDPTILHFIHPRVAGV
mmetsp:Transcript_21886/g.58365  ORF Transcript_21886/g.58365 Transcript_21886/m.58365 type:complete len:152 (+) Transcript_21886:48-503(+)